MVQADDAWRGAARAVRLLNGSMDDIMLIPESLRKIVAARMESEVEGLAETACLPWHSSNESLKRCRFLTNGSRQTRAGSFLPRRSSSALWTGHQVQADKPWIT
jgi:hypothetical protein